MFRVINWNHLFNRGCFGDPRIFAGERVGLSRGTPDPVARTFPRELQKAPFNINASSFDRPVGCLLASGIQFFIEIVF